MAEKNEDAVKVPDRKGKWSIFWSQNKWEKAETNGGC